MNACFSFRLSLFGRFAGRLHRFVPVAFCAGGAPLRHGVWQ